MAEDIPKTNGAVESRVFGEEVKKYDVRMGDDISNGVRGTERRVFIFLGSLCTQASYILSHLTLQKMMYFVPISMWWEPQ